MKIKDFSLSDQNGKIHSLNMYLGKWVVLYFYPKDDTPGCTKEACSFRDASGEYQKKNIIVLGISKDSVDSHKKFADKFHLNFPILSDESIDVIKSYKAWGQKKFLGKTFAGIVRTTYLINPEGTIVKIYAKVNPFTHAGEVLADVKKLI